MAASVIITRPLVCNPMQSVVIARHEYIPPPDLNAHIATRAIIIKQQLQQQEQRKYEIDNLNYKTTTMSTGGDIYYYEHPTINFDDVIVVETPNNRKYIFTLDRTVTQGRTHPRIAQ